MSLKISWLFVWRRTNDLREKLSSAQEELRQLDMDIEESQGSWYLQSFYDYYVH